MPDKRKEDKSKRNKQQNRAARQQRKMVDQLENEIIDQAFVIIEELMVIIKAQIEEPDLEPEPQYQSRGIVNARTNIPLSSNKDNGTTNQPSDISSNVTMEVNHRGQSTSNTSTNNSNSNSNSSNFQYRPAEEQPVNISLNNGSQFYPGTTDRHGRPTNSSTNALFERLRGPIQNNRSSVVNPTRVNNDRRNQHLSQSQPQQTIVGADAFQFANRLVSGSRQNSNRSVANPPAPRATRSVSQPPPRPVASVQSSRPSTMRAPSVAIAA